MPPLFPQGLAGDSRKVPHQPLIICVMHMSVKHKGPGTSILFPVKLSVIAEDRIMRQDHLPFPVMDLGIRPDPFEPAPVKVLILQEPLVMISLDQVQLSLQLLCDLIGGRSFRD